MLAKLFNNISIPSLVRAIVVSLLASVLAVLWIQGSNEQLRIHFFGAEFTLITFQILAVLIVVSMATLLNSGVNNIGFLKNDYQYIVIFALLVLPMVFSMGANLELLLVLPLGGFMILRLLSLVTTIDPSYILFDSGVLLGIMTVLVPETGFLMLIIWLAVFNFGHGGVRTLLMPVLGLSAVYFMGFTLLYWFSGMNGLKFLSESFSEIKTGFHFSDIEKIWVYIPLVLAVVPAMFETTQIYGKASVHKRQIFTFLLAMSAVLIVAGSYVSYSFTLWVWLSIPFAALVVNLIHYRKKAWQKDIYYVLLAVFLLLSILF